MMWEPLSGVEGCEKQIRLDQGVIKRDRKAARDSHKATSRGVRSCTTFIAFHSRHSSVLTTFRTINFIISGI